MPSKDDKETTKRLLKCGKILNIPMIDHIIVAGESGRMTSGCATSSIEMPNYLHRLEIKYMLIWDKRTVQGYLSAQQIGSCANTNGSPQINKTNHLNEAYEFGKTIYK